MLRPLHVRPSPKTESHGATNIRDIDTLNNSELYINSRRTGFDHHKHLKDESPAMKMRLKTKKRHLVTVEHAGLALQVASATHTHTQTN